MYEGNENNTITAEIAHGVLHGHVCDNRFTAIATIQYESKKPPTKKSRTDGKKPAIKIT